ncbi:MAG: GIY-YIG nuclease family protein [Vicinamibacteria bacterium]|nr:GIY-YIG nuclease family protein [Vicinamibacteria bacterium]
MAFVYILRCRDDSFYTGATMDVAGRLRLHQAGRASRYTRARLPVTLVWHCRRPSWSDALREERRIKKLRHSEKLALIITARPGARRYPARGAAHGRSTDASRSRS